MRKIKLILILSFLLIFLTCNLASNPAFSMDYETSINNAMDNESSDSKINTFYTPDISTLYDSNNITRASGATTQILMTSWSKSVRNLENFAGNIVNNGKTPTSPGYDVWLSPAQQLYTNLSSKGVTSGNAVHDALAKTIGLDTSSTNNLVLEIWATRDSNILQRPTLNPAINALPINGGLTAGNLNILSNSGCADWATFIAADSTLLANKLAPIIKSNMQSSGITWDDAQSLIYAKFLVGQAKWAYGSTPKTWGAPWTGLGYTYNWAASNNALDPSNWANSIRGESEYVQIGSVEGSTGNNYEIGAIYSDQSYIYRVKTPVVGDSSTWSNGDFKVTSSLNTLWAGRRFQLNGSSIDVTSAGNISGKEGVLVSSLGYTLNNAGSITSLKTEKKFNIAGTDDIAILFQGDTPSASLPRMNTVINSGTIGDTSVTAPTTAIKAIGDTLITNSGNIFGNLDIINSDATIKTTAGTINGNIKLTNSDATITATGGKITGGINTTVNGLSAINLNNATITGGNLIESENNIGTLNINAADVSVTGTTQINSDANYSSILKINSNSANFNNNVDIIGANSRLISTGATTFNNPVTVSGGTLSLYGATSMPSLSAGSTLDMQNGTINTVTSGTTTLTDNVNLFIDATGTSNDSFDTTGKLTENGHSFVLKSINLLSTPQNSSFILNNVIQAGPGSDPISLSTTQLSSINTPIGTYSLRALGGSLFASLTDFNPQVFRGQVSVEAAYANQLTTNNVLFDHIDLVSQQLLSAEKPNVYANENPLFAPYQYNKEDGSIWYKAYGNIERLQLTQDINTQNNMWGSLLGADFPLVKLKNGWSVLPTAYIGYTGAYQTFSGVNMYQNGGQGGIMGTFYKGDFITSLLANVGGYGNSMSVGGTTDRTGNWFAGVASKSAYNIELPKDFILQPTMLFSYNAFGKQSWDTSFGNTSMLTNFFNGFNIAPGLNLILSKETWSIYATTQLMFNVINGVNGSVGNIDLPTVKMGSTYFQYGIGFTKRFKDRLSIYGQIIFSNGVRTGVGFQGGLQWKI